MTDKSLHGAPRMFALASSTPARFRKAAIGTAAVVGASMLAALPAAAQSTTKKVSLPSAPPGQEQMLKEIPKAHCDYLFFRADEALQEDGKNSLSSITRKSLIAFWAFDAKELPTCKGPREIAWERGSDFDFIMALASLGSTAYKPIDFRIDYGLKPAARPTVRGVPTSQNVVPRPAGAGG